MDHHKDPLSRWSGYSATREAGVTRGWMPNLAIEQAEQKQAKQMHQKWVEQNGPADSRNRLGPLKPHDMLVTARVRRPSAVHLFDETKEIKAYWCAPPCPAPRMKCVLWQLNAHMFLRCALGGQTQRTDTSPRPRTL